MSFNRQGSGAKGFGGLIKLQSEDHEEILDVIDQLRAEGIGRYVDLPQLIVCGDQSSGKSSVLEAISGLDFPRRDNICTRFATELILRRTPNAGVTASIYPDDSRPPAEKEQLRSFRLPTVSLDKFGDIVKSAEDAIGVKKDGLSFSKDVLRVEVYGPNQPHLTLVDLPGLYHAPDESQDQEGVDFVESLVLSYMENRRSVMLAVVSGKADIALQKVTSFTRKLDPSGERTMGIITKPDTLPNGSDMEQSFFKLAQNTRMPFRLGWHVLKNRSYEERDFSLSQRDESEKAFLLQGIWSQLPRTSVGIKSLRPRLSVVLKHHILSQMSGFIAETQASLNDAESGLQKLGEPRQMPLQQRQYLLQGSDRFTSVINAAVLGTYADTFFGDARLEIGAQKRLRAVVQNRLAELSKVLRDKGEDRKIVEDDVITKPDDGQIKRSEYVKEVIRLISRSRGRELPGNFNPLIIGDLFFIHSRPWQAIIDKCTEQLLADVRRTLFLVLQDALDARSAERMLKHVINPRLAECETQLQKKITELLTPQQLGHPITHNRHYIMAVQEAREEHRRKSNTQKLEKFFGTQYPQSPREQSRYTFTMNSLIDALGSQQDFDMEHYAASEAIDCMIAYYKVARKKFVDDFSILAIEKCLLEPLLTLYCPLTVFDLPEDVINEIANEDEATMAERDRLREKAEVLKRCLKNLHRLDLHGLSAKEASSPPDSDDSDTDSSAASVKDDESENTEVTGKDEDADMNKQEAPILVAAPREVTTVKSLEDIWRQRTPSSRKKKHVSSRLFEPEDS